MDPEVIIVSPSATQTDEKWRAEGRIFGYMLVNCMVCAIAGYALGVRGGVLDIKGMYVLLWCLLFITAYAMSIGTFINKKHMNKDTIVLLAALWLCYALAGYVLWRG